METDPSSPNNISSMITMHQLLPPAFPSPSPPPPLTKSENRRKLIKQLRKKKNILQADHRRWHKRNHQIIMILFSCLSIYAIVLVGVLVMPTKYSFDCLYSTAQTAMGIIGIFYALKCGKTLKFTNKQLLENREKKSELKRVWEELKQHPGIADDEEEFDVWFVDEGSPSSRYLVVEVAPAAAFLFSIVAATSLFYFSLTCWFRCGIKSFFNCVY